MTDFYLLDEKLTDDERGIRDRLRAFCEREVTPVINGYWERAEFPFELVPKIAALQMAGGTIEGYGCPGMSATAAGLVSMEWARADGSMGTFYGVHSNLAMQSIAMLGSDEQKQRWLPAMADLDAIGAFALTEPDHGSDAVHLETAARADGDDYVIDGRKRWIGNATIADVVIVWARDEDGHVGGYLVEKGTPGFNATVMTGKTALRAVWQADIELDGVRVPAENKLPGAGTSATSPACSRAPATRSRGARSAWRSAPTRSRSRTRRSASSSASRSRATSSCRTSSAGCWPRSPRCSCCACGCQSSPATAA